MQKHTNMEIVYRRLAELNANPKNPRKPRPNRKRGRKDEESEAIRDLAESIKGNPLFFEARPILLSDRTGELVIIAGEQRSRAAALLGMEQVPTILIPGLTEAQEDEIMVKDNTHAGVWDENKLKTWGRAQLEAWNVDGVVWPKEPVIEDDSFDPDAKAEAKCKPGEMWSLGEHRLMCGDATKREDVARLLGGGQADMVFVDPPYGVSYTEKNEFLCQFDKSIRNTTPISNDSMTPKEMAAFWERAFNLLAEFTAERMVFYITSPQGGDLLLLLLQSVASSPLALKHMLIWNKNNHVLGRCDYDYKHEPIIYGWKKKGTHTFYGGGRFKTSVWDIPKPQKSDLHPTMKPVELVANCILDGTDKGGSVLDTFGGSGTTLIAAEQTGRKCYMMELEPSYCDIIIQRWETLTGKKAVKIE